MCLGCLVGACTFAVTWGSGQLIAWRAMAKRERAMKRAAGEDDAPEAQLAEVAEVTVAASRA